MSTGRQPYTQEISRAHPACFLFLLDQSFSMEDALAGGEPSQQKQIELAKAINAWLSEMIIRVSRGNKVLRHFEVGVVGYCTDEQNEPIIGPILQGPLAGRYFVPIDEIADNPLGVEKVTKMMPDEATGELVPHESEMPVWVQPKAQGGTPMCTALYGAYGELEKWIAAENHKESFPPIVVHITDGDSMDGDPIEYANPLKSLFTDDGNVLLFNCHLSETAADPVPFPSSSEVLPDKLAKVLFEMSSLLPEPMFQRARAEGVADLQPNARGMAFNADMKTLIRFLDIGTRASKTLR